MIATTEPVLPVSLTASAGRGYLLVCHRVPARYFCDYAVLKINNNHCCQTLEYRIAVSKRLRSFRGGNYQVGTLLLVLSVRIGRRYKKKRKEEAEKKKWDERFVTTEEYRGHREVRINSGRIIITGVVLAVRCLPGAHLEGAPWKQPLTLSQCHSLAESERACGSH